MTYPASNSNPNSAPSYLQGLNPYFRFAYQSDEYAGHNWMVGFLGANINQYASCNTVASSGSYRGAAPTCDGPVNSPALSAGTVGYQDRAIDAQYQYLVDPHAVTAQTRYTKENISDPTGILYSNASNKTNSFMAKISYVYNATYGAAVGFQNITGTADSRYGTNAVTGAGYRLFGISPYKMYDLRISTLHLPNITAEQSTTTVWGQMPVQIMQAGSFYGWRCNDHFC